MDLILEPLDLTILSYAFPKIMTEWAPSPTLSKTLWNDFIVYPDQEDRDKGLLWEKTETLRDLFLKSSQTD